MKHFVKKKKKIAFNQSKTMIQIIEQIIKYYLQYKKKPTVGDLEIQDISLMEDKKSLFVTLYKNGEVRGASGCINGNKRPVISELIDNTVIALSEDSRFNPVELKEIQDIKIRLDIIESREVLSDKKISDLDPTKSGILAIKKDYENIALILANMHPVLITGDDYQEALKNKLNDQNFSEENYLLFEIISQTESNF